MVGTQPWCGLAHRPGTIPQEQKGSLAVSLKTNSLPWKLEEASPAAVPETDWGMEPEQHFCIFLSFLVFSNTSGVFPAALYPDLYALPCPWMLLSFAPCPWATVFSSMPHTPAVLILGPRARHFPDPWAPSAWRGCHTSGRHLSSDEGKEWVSDQTTLDNDRSPRARMGDFDSGTSMGT